MEKKMTENKKAKLLSFEANNIMCLRFAECSFGEDGQLVKVGGQNGAGKSCLLDALNFAFYGKKGVGKPDVLRYGADKGYVKVQLGGREFQIRRSINDKGGEVLTVRDADGNALKKAQTVLNELVGTIGIDPSVIWKMDDKQIAEKLREVMGVDLGDLDAKEKELTEQRKWKKKDVEQAQKQFDEAEFYSGYPDEPTSMSDLAKELNEANQHNEKLRNSQNDLRKAEGQVLAIEQEIEKLNERIIQLKKDQELQWSKALELKDLIEKDVEIDTNAITSRMSTIEAENQKVVANKRRGALELQLEEGKSVVENLNKDIEAVRQERRERIAQARFPLDGVGFDAEGNFTMDNQPWNSYSDGERLFAAFELSVAMNPNLQLVIIRNGAWIDDVGRNDIAEIAMERGYLVLMEVVGEHDVQIVMENGQMKDLRE
jgi:energy-coupling factor transporter ATP-binding protein EcfA2